MCATSMRLRSQITLRNAGAATKRHAIKQATSGTARDRPTNRQRKAHPLLNFATPQDYMPPTPGSAHRPLEALGTQTPPREHRLARNPDPRNGRYQTEFGLNHGANKRTQPDAPQAAHTPVRIQGRARAISLPKRQINEGAQTAIPSFGCADAALLTTVVLASENGDQSPTTRLSNTHTCVNEIEEGGTLQSGMRLRPDLPGAGKHGQAKVPWAAEKRRLLAGKNLMAQEQQEHRRNNHISRQHLRIHM